MFSRGLLLVGLITGLSVAGWANPVDPRISIDNGGFSDPLTDQGQSFTLNGNGGGVFDFKNCFGEDIFELAISVLFPSEGFGDLVFDVESNIFAQHEIVTTPTDDSVLVTIRFFGSDETHPGVIAQSNACDSEGCHEDFIPASEFTANFNDLICPPCEYYDCTPSVPNNDTDGSGGWGSGSTATFSQINQVPETSSLPVLAVGLVVLFVISRFRAARTRA